MDTTTLVRTIATADPDEVPEVLAAALAGPGDWLDEQYLRRPADRDWMLYPLYRAADGRRSLVIAVFRPGAEAPIHDHGSWAAIGIYRGRERETWYRMNAEERLERVRSFVNGTGAVSVIPDGVIHTVRALDDTDAISIHVYGTDIVTQERNMFDPHTHRASRYLPPFTETTSKH
ncbi:cysteine dioxygenase family protein [Actinoplanes sp. NPDC049668]|uniref:cysteine dioxygenase family protein n=1 Tax=unclassified Actinoplanes TaxID=2626549 RepID=UPI0033B8CE01